MDAKQLIMLAFQVAILATVFGFGLKATRADALYVLGRPWLLARSLLALFVVMPVLIATFVTIFDFPATIEIVLMALAVSPVPPLLPQREEKAGGHHSYALGLMFIAAAIAVVAVPLILGVLSHVFNRPLSIDAWTIARIVLMMVLAPLVAGALVRWLAPRIAARLEKPVHLLAVVLLVVGALVVIAGTWEAIWAATGRGTVLAIVAFVLLGLLVGHFLGGPEPSNRTVLGLSCACRHPAIALALASANYPDMRFGSTILLYLIVSLIVGFPYIAWRRRVSAATSA